MSDYVIFTDSGCDISPTLLKEWGVQYRSLSFQFEDEGVEYSNEDMPIKDFYNRMRAGGIAKTSAINVGTFFDAFEEVLKQGMDILYLGFSSGLSATYSSGVMAAEQLRKQYPERKIITVDTLCASAGQGLLVYLTLQQKRNGASIEDAAAYAENTKLNIYHWVTVNDLVYLKRGGRISPTVAFVGSILSIKPMIYVNNEGKLLNVAKARGRKTALRALADKYGELAQDPENGTVFISHSDCLEEVNALGEILRERYNAKFEVITDIGTVIGAHTGPGAIALFFVANGR